MGGYATLFMAIDRRKGCQVACKVVKFKNSSSKPVTSHYFKAAQNAGLAGIGAFSGKEPNSVKLWREVELLKTIHHVSSLHLSSL